MSSKRARQGASLEAMVVDPTQQREVTKWIKVMEPSADVLVVALHHRKMNQQHKNISSLPGIREKVNLMEEFAIGFYVPGHSTATVEDLEDFLSCLEYAAPQVVTKEDI